MQRYKGTKVVKAGEIESFEVVHLSKLVRFKLKDISELVETKMSVIARGEPEIGDYLVEYKDGYQSISPKAIFEEAYKELLEETITEKRMVKLGLTAPKVTSESISDLIVGEQYHQFEGTTVTICCLTLENGFNVIGKSACVSPENFNEQLGKDLAKEEAINEIGHIEGYLLKQQIYQDTLALAIDTSKGTEVNTKVSKKKGAKIKPILNK